MISLILSESTGQVEFNLAVMIGCWNLLISNDVVNSFVLEKLYMCFTSSLGKIVHSILINNYNFYSKIVIICKTI